MMHELMRKLEISEKGINELEYGTDGTTQNSV